MSYDLAVFDPSVAPRGREEFRAWYRLQTRWSEGHGYNDPAVSTLPLQAWFFAMIKEFPALNGPHATENVDSDMIADYSVGRNFIYVGFAWRLAERAYAGTFRLANKYRVGFFNVSSNEGEVWLPDPGGGLNLSFKVMFEKERPNNG